MCNEIVCTPKTVPVEKMIVATRKAIEINSLNAPSEAMLAIIGRSPNPSELGALTGRYWRVGEVRLTVGFLDNPSQELRRRILFHMNAWNKTANVEFIETNDIDHAHVRINRQRINNPRWDGYWSFLGTDILEFSGPYNQTMNLEGLTMNTSEFELRRIVTHEAGHTLGFVHEHMRKEFVMKIDREKAIEHYRVRNGWSELDVIQQVLTPVSDLHPRSSDPDQYSIMSYHVPSGITIDGRAIFGGTDISVIDYETAGLIYPK